VDVAAADPPSDRRITSWPGATKGEGKMLRAISRMWRVFALGAAALSLATTAAAQATEKKETVPGGPASVKTTQVKGELVAKGSNWLIAKDPAGNYKLYNVQPGRKAIVDGVPKTLDEIKVGTMLTSTATTTETPMVNRTTTITQGTVFWASPKSIIVTLQNGENKQYEVPEGFTFDVDGKKLSAMELRPGMKLTGTKVVEEPVNVITQDVVVTGTGPK
jgi:hypothetical protein